MATNLFIILLLILNIYYNIKIILIKDLIVRFKPLLHFFKNQNQSLILKEFFYHLQGKISSFYFE